MKRVWFMLICFISAIGAIGNDEVAPVVRLIERIAPGASDKFDLELVDDAGGDFFELDQNGSKVVVRANNCVSLASGLNWYLKYYAGVHLSWNCMKAELPDVLPSVAQPERHECAVPYRYYLNYCTYSYSMAFWDWNRWEREIDWMALHGINLPLALVGTDTVWRNMLLKLGYTAEEADGFIAGPGFQAWWLMNNLEGWGGPNPSGWYDDRQELQIRILARMRELGMEPVLPGYAGMVPHDARTRLGLDVADPGLWCAYTRPAFLLPTDSRFSEIAAMYYDELTRLYGPARFYSMDPFHEGGSVDGVDLEAAGRSIMDAMKAVNPDAVWVIQAWQDNPRSRMIRSLPKGDMLVLDLYSESYPQWGDKDSPWYRPDGFDGHDWAFCMLLNYGGNVGLHGKLQHVADEYHKAYGSTFASTMKGIGLTMEGIENNPVMYELMCELPWRKNAQASGKWLDGYIKARYGAADDSVSEAWQLLARSVYGAPASLRQQGTAESIFCARPSADAWQVSTWSGMKPYYEPDDVIRAAALMLEAAPRLHGNDNYRYDLVDVMRQAVAEKGRMVYDSIKVAWAGRDADALRRYGDSFLDLLQVQDSLLGTRSEFRVGRWIEQARALGRTEEDKALIEWNARTQITTWGNRTAADNGGLHDYAHKEWNGILRDFYANRWRLWLDAAIHAASSGDDLPVIDWYAVEEPWTRRTGGYSAAPEGDPVVMARRAYEAIMQ